MVKLTEFTSCLHLEKSPRRSVFPRRDAFFTRYIPATRGIITVLYKNFTSCGEYAAKKREMSYFYLPLVSEF